MCRLAYYSALFIFYMTFIYFFNTCLLLYFLFVAGTIFAFYFAHRLFLDWLEIQGFSNLFKIFISQKNHAPDWEKIKILEISNVIEFKFIEFNF